MLMCPGVWPGVGTAVSSRVRLCSPCMNSQRPRSASGHTHCGAFTQRVGWSAGSWHESQSFLGIQ